MSFSFVALLFFSSFSINSFYGQLADVEENSFYYFFDKTDPLVSKTESLKEIEFQFNHREKDTSPLVFIYSKNSKSRVDTIFDISSYKLQGRSEIGKLGDKFSSYLNPNKNKEPKIVYFPKWLESMFKSFYVIEKSKDFYLKYRVTVSQMEVDYQLM